MRMRLLPLLAALLALPAMLAAAPAEVEAPLAIELNAIEPQEGACRLIFVAQNGTGADVDALVLEAVLFDAEGRVAALTLLDFRDLPAGRTRVRPFDMAGLECWAIARLLINDIATCEGAADCAAALSPSTRIDIELLQ